MTTSPASTNVTSPGGPTGRLSNWVHSVKLSDIPAEVQERAKHLILDGIACAFIGAHLPWSETGTKAILNTETGGPCTVIGWGADRKVSPMASAMINSSFIQGFELDDVHADSPLHTASLLLPALFAAARLPLSSPEKYTGAQFLQSYVIGCEVGPRVGLALGGPDLLSRGWHSGTVMGPSAVASAVSSLYSLPPNQIEDALGMACTQAGGLMSAQFGSMAKRMQHGFASRNGLLAVLLAQGGYTGIKQVYEQPYGGFLGCFSMGSERTPQNVPEEIYKGLGEIWQIMRIKVKGHACMAALHAPVDAIETLQQEHPESFTDSESISGIEVKLGKAAYDHGGWITDPKEPLTDLGAQMSVQCAVATQLLDKQVLMEQFSEKALARPELRKLMQIVKPVHEPTFDERKQDTFKTTVTVTFKDGSSLSDTKANPRFIDPGLSNSEIVDKWRNLVGGLSGMDRTRMEKIEQAVLNIDKAGSNVVDLVELLEGVVGSPL